MFYITGSNGFVGKNLVEFLLNKKVKYKKIKHDKFTSKNQSSYNNLKKVYSNKNCLIHLSSPALIGLYRKKNYSKKEILECYKNEIFNSLSLVEFCIKNKFEKIIYMSTSSIYGNRAYNIPFDEEDPENPENEYSKIKFYNEILIKFLFKNTIILRPFQIYGKYDSPKRLIPTLLNTKINQVLKLQDCLQVTDLIHVRDLCEVIFKLKYSRIKNGTYNVGSGYPVKLRKIVEKLYHFRKKKFFFKFKKTNMNKIYNYCYSNNSKIMKAVNWKPSIIFNNINNFKDLC